MDAVPLLRPTGLWLFFIPRCVHLFVLTEPHPPQGGWVGGGGGELCGDLAAVAARRVVLLGRPWADVDVLIRQTGGGI